MNNNWQGLFDKTNITEDTLREYSESLLYADLHSESFKEILLNNQYKKKNIFQDVKIPVFEYAEQDQGIFKINERKTFLQKLGIENFADHSIPTGLLFFTRPITALELCFLLPKWCQSSENLSEFEAFLELFRISFPLKALQVIDINKEIKQIEIATDDLNLNRIFALTSFQTEVESWKAVVKDKGIEPDPQRYERLFELINNILACKKNIDYIVFPELSLPRRTITYLALKLKTKGISLIAGIEYESKSAPSSHSSIVKGIVSNQLIYVLNINNSGGKDQVCIIQEKVIAALEEAKNLFEEGGKVLEASTSIKYIVNHGGLFMSGLICNDLLNIDYRQSLRGKIDTLIVIEWNKDVDTYDALVSATANDLHCYVVQVNNRAYGDTRLRAPYKESYQRDRVRVRGGELDYFVLTSLEIVELRKFQDHHISPPLPFKPVPTGFVMSEERRLSIL